MCFVDIIMPWSWQYVAERSIYHLVSACSRCDLHSTVVWHCSRCGRAGN